jgi:phosphohistidine phosphatase
MSTPHLKLLLLRHALAGPATANSTDHDRRLTPRGNRDAARLGQHLQEASLSPDLLLCSDAVRTRETLDAMGDNLPPDCTVRYEPKLYVASTEAVLDLVLAAEDHFRTIMVLGHNPSIASLALHLIEDPGGPADERAVAPLNDHLALQADFPPCGLTVIAFRGDKWRDIAPSTGVLESFVTPATFG